MLIWIISDTHDNAINMLKAFNVFNEKKVDLVIHVWDWVSPFMLRFCKNLNAKIISIYGNNEKDEYRYPKMVNNFWVNVEFFNDKKEFEFDNRKFYIIHWESNEEIENAISSWKYDVVLSGHNHQAKIEKIGNTLHINPGTTCWIKDDNVYHEITVSIYDTISWNGEIIKI